MCGYGEKFVMIEWWFVAALLILALSLRDSLRDLIIIYSLVIPWYIFSGWKGFGIGLFAVFITCATEGLFLNRKEEED